MAHNPDRTRAEVEAAATPTRRPVLRAVAPKALWAVLATALLAGCAGPSKHTDKPAVADPAPAAELVTEGRQALDQGRKDAAIKAWEKAVQRDPADAVTVNNLALLLKEQHRFADAARLLKEGLEHSPEVAELHYNLAVIAELYLLDLETALAHYTRYRALVGEQEQQVAGWIADLERRLQ